jgi:hypothetical protein
MYKYLIFEILSALVGAIAIIFIFVWLWKKKHLHRVVRKPSLYIPVTLLIIAFFAGLISNRTYSPDFAMPMFMHSHAPGGISPAIPFRKIIEFFKNEDRFEKIKDIGADPNAVPAEAQKPDADGIVRISMTTREVISEIAPEYILIIGHLITKFPVLCSV